MWTPTAVVRSGKVIISLLVNAISLFLAGFTAIVNKQLSAKYAILVDGAPNFIKVLPWGPDFEVDVFRKPDFTALEVVTFATGGRWTCSAERFPLKLYPLFRHSYWNQRIIHIFPFLLELINVLDLTCTDTGKPYVTTLKQS